jgi:hypothetical protein
VIVRATKLNLAVMSGEVRAGKDLCSHGALELFAYKAMAPLSRLLLDVDCEMIDKGWAVFTHKAPTVHQRPKVSALHLSQCS